MTLANPQDSEQGWLWCNSSSPDQGGSRALQSRSKRLSLTATFLRSAKSGNAGLGATSLVCAILCNSWHSKVIQKFYGLMARRNACTNHELLCFTGRGFKICASDVTRVRPYALKNHKDAWSMASNENGNPSESRRTEMSTLRDDPAFCGLAISMTDFARKSLSFRCLQASLSKARNRGNQFGRFLTSRSKNDQTGESSCPLFPGVYD